MKEHICEKCEHEKECRNMVCFYELLEKEEEKIRADEREKIIDELHKELEMQIRENPKIIYVDNKDYLSVARGSVLQVIHETLEQLKEQK